jgi:phage terminase small subunit
MKKRIPAKRKSAKEAPKCDTNLPKPVPKSTLNYKQQIFVAEYLIDLNATQAAIRAGYSERSARQVSARLMTNAVIKAEMDAEIERRKLNCVISSEEIINELALLGRGDINDYLRITEDGTVQMIPLDQLSKDKSRCVKKVKERRVIKTLKGTKDQPDGDLLMEATVEYELWDKVKSLELLARHKGLLHDKLELDSEKPIILVKSAAAAKTTRT